jgi:precorrin-4 C11-methyltransferase
MTAPSKIALIAVTRRGIEQARRLRKRLRSGEMYRPESYGPAESPWEHVFTRALSETVPKLFAEQDQLVFFLATGAVTRLIAPCLVSKTSDPGVLAVDETGRFVVPVLSGHVGGANAFARTVAGCLGATPVITTASDVMGGFSPDMLADAFGWTAEPAERLKAAALALVNQEQVAIVQEIGSRGSWLDEQELPANVVCVRAPRNLPDRAYAKVLWITDRLPGDRRGFADDDMLWYRPRSLVLGVGCERGISLAALEDGLARFLDEHGFSRSSIAVVASVDVKADEPALIELARNNDWQTAFYPSAELAQVPGVPNPSAVVEKCVGTPGVAEPSALLASGAERLLVDKQVLTSPHAAQRMTFALARLNSFEVSTGKRGRVTFVGAGPGDPELMTLKGRRLLGKADIVVYAGSLIPEPVLKHAPATAVLHNSAHLTLEEVMTILIDAARAGKRVVRLQSGDTSIYSAIQEQLTLLDDSGIDFDVVPGVSSFQAAAAALCAELTLPETVQTIILTRAEGETPMPAGESLADLARHRATLAIFLSARLSENVQKQLLTSYPADTAVAICHRVSWPDEQIIRTTLADLHETIHRHKFTRTVLILVGAALRFGNPGRRQHRSQLYHPGYGHIFRARSREE